jgi:disulfide bond formation protein DsbB
MREPVRSPGMPMLARDPVMVRTNPAVAAALAVALVGAATILGAWFFEFGLGLAPCPLCLQQRIPYYAAIPLALVVAVAAERKAPRALVVAGLGVIALAMLIGVALGVYHAGIEWKWWQGPQDCSGPLVPLGSRGLLEQLQSINVVRCDEAPWSFLGLSLAGYNALISALLAALAVWGIVAQRRAPS